MRTSARSFSVNRSIAGAPSAAHNATTPDGPNKNETRLQEKPALEESRLNTLLLFQVMGHFVNLASNVKQLFLDLAFSCWRLRAVVAKYLSRGVDNGAAM